MKNERRHTIQEHLIESSYLKKKMTLIVSLPTNFSPLFTYPVLIAQDGQDYFNLGRLASTVNHLTQKKLIEEIIVVGIPYESVSTRWETYHPQGGLQEAYQEFLMYECLPFLERHYPLHPLAGGRAFIGDSLGGTVSLMTALHYHHSIGYLILQSPFINDEILTHVEHDESIAMLSIYHTVGRMETNVKTTKGTGENFLKENRKLHQILERKHIASYIYEELDGDHTWGTWQPNLTQALRSIFRKGYI